MIKNIFKKCLILLVLAALLLGGCSVKNAAPEESEETETESTEKQSSSKSSKKDSKKDKDKNKDENGDKTEAETPPEEDKQPAKSILLDDVVGLWELYSTEVEGDYYLAEEDGREYWLYIRPDATADLIKLSLYDEKQELDFMPVESTESGTLSFTCPEAKGVVYQIISAADGELTLDLEWTNTDGTPGGSTWVFSFSQAYDPDSPGRRLSEYELEALTDSLDYDDNGFFVCTYERPEEIDWREVLYNGAGISISLTPEMRSAYEAQYGEIFTDIDAFYPDDIADFVWAKTDTPYSWARKPVAFFWNYLLEYDLYLHEHGDTNVQGITFTDGYADGPKYTLYYYRADFENYIFDSRLFAMTAYIRDGSWQYVSNLPADAPAPIALLDIEYCETKEDAEKLGVTEFYDIEMLPSDEPYGFVWAVVTAQEDDVRYIVDRAADSEYFAVYGIGQPGEYLASGVLDEGESFAIYVNQPWHPSIRVTATKDAYWGEYWFGEDNWLHLDDSVTRYITGHDLAGEGRGCEPETEEQLVNFLTDGAWAYLDEETGEILASVRFDDYRWMEISTEEAYFTVYLDYDRIYASQDEAPDLLCMERDEYSSSDWDLLPSWFGDSLGDYLVSAVQLDGEQILYLDQANNGDGALGYMLPGADENSHSFMLHRWRGTAELEGQG